MLLPQASKITFLLAQMSLSGPCNAAIVVAAAGSRASLKCSNENFMACWTSVLVMLAIPAMCCWHRLKL